MIFLKEKPHSCDCVLLRKTIDVAVLALIMNTLDESRVTAQMLHLKNDIINDDSIMTSSTKRMIFLDK